MFDKDVALINFIYLSIAVFFVYIWVCWFSRFSWFFKIGVHHAVYYSVELYCMLWVACVFGSKSTDSYMQRCWKCNTANWNYLKFIKLVMEG